MEDKKQLTVIMNTTGELANKLVSTEVPDVDALRFIHWVNEFEMEYKEGYTLLWQKN